MTVSVAWGLVAYFALPENAGLPEQADHAFVQFVAREFPQLLRSLVVAGLIAALVSTFDSGLNSSGAVLVSDFYRRWCPERSEHHYVRMSRLFILGMSVVVVLFTIWQFRFRDQTALQRIGQLNAVLSGPMSTIFVLGVISRRTTGGCAIFGGVVSLTAALLLNGFPNVFEPPIAGINWMWVAGISTIAGVAGGLLASHTNSR